MKTIFIDCNAELGAIWQRVTRPDDPPVTINTTPFETGELPRGIGARVGVVAQIITVDEGGGAKNVLDLARVTIFIPIEIERIGAVSSQGRLGVAATEEVLTVGTSLLSGGALSKLERACRCQTQSDCKRDEA